MEKEYLIDDGSELEKKIKKIIWTVGGIGAAIIVGFGIYLMLDIPVLGLVAIGGLVPFDLLLTYLTTQCFSVRTVYVVDDYTIEGENERENNLVLLKKEDKKQEMELVRQDVEFTEINPTVHLEIVNSSNREKYSRSRKIDYNKK